MTRAQRASEARMVALSYTGESSIFSTCMVFSWNLSKNSRWNSGLYLSTQNLLQSSCPPPDYPLLYLFGTHNLAISSSLIQPSSPRVEAFLAVIAASDLGTTAGARKL